VKLIGFRSDIRHSSLIATVVQAEANTVLFSDRYYP
jgi:hypothetical protein